MDTANGKINANEIKIITALTILEGVVALWFLFWIPSMDKNTNILGYSSSRIIIGGIFLLLLLILSFIYARMSLNRDWLLHFEKMVANTFKNSNSLSLLILYLLLVIFWGIVSILFFKSAISEPFGMIGAVFERVISLVCWLMIITGQFLVLFWKSYRSRITSKGFFPASNIIQSFLISLILVGTIFHLLILYLQVNIFTDLPNWYWKFRPKEFTIRDWIFPFMCLFAIAVILEIIRKPKKQTRNILILIVSGVIFQAGFGFIEGDGFESIRLKFAKAGHSRYAQYACFEPNLLMAMVDYEKQYGDEMYLDTKPPGTLVFNIVVQRIADLFIPADDYDGKYRNMSTFMAFIFPVFTFITLIPLFSVSRKYLDGAATYIPCILFVFMPNVVLMVLEMDLVLYPLLFIIAIFLWQQSLRKRSIALAAISGVYVYFSLYFSYSLLPLVPIILVWTIADYWINRHKTNLSSVIKLVFSFLVGITIANIIFSLAFNYHFISRYQNAMSSHQFHKKYEFEPINLLDTILLNNIEFAMWSGVPIILLFFSSMGRVIASLFKKAVSSLDSLAIAFLLTFIALNIFGQTRSEVGRLWIFLLPTIVIFSADEVNRFFNNRNKVALATLLIVILQLVTIFFTYKFQDAINL